MAVRLRDAMAGALLATLFGMPTAQQGAAPVSGIYRHASAIDLSAGSSYIYIYIYIYG